MHHCVFTNEYYLKADSLILSATIDGKRIETIEVSLKRMEVVQSRGVCNKNTPIPRANTETDEGEHVPYTETNDSIKIGAAKAARKNKIE
mgnify:FL=1